MPARAGDRDEEELIQIATERVPEDDFRAGDIEALLRAQRAREPSGPRQDKRPPRRFRVRERRPDS